MRRNDFRGPDFFLVLNTSPHGRNAWVVWAEDGRTPDVVIELVSKSTAANDLGPKKEIYGTQLKVGEYFVFDPESGGSMASSSTRQHAVTRQSGSRPRVGCPVPQRGSSLGYTTPSISGSEVRGSGGLRRRV